MYKVFGILVCVVQDLQVVMTIIFFFIFFFFTILKMLTFAHVLIMPGMQTTRKSESLKNSGNKCF